MKILISLICICCLNTLCAQDQQLFDHTWYIHKLEIDDEEIFPPEVDDAINLDLYMQEQINGQYQFSTGFCEGFSGQMWFQGESSFTLQDDPINLIGSCTLAESLEFKIGRAHV